MKDKAESVSEIDEKLQGLVARHLPPTVGDTTVGPGIEFSDAGMTSVAFLELLIATEDTFGISLTSSTADLAGAATLEGLRGLVKAKIEQRK